MDEIFNVQDRAHLDAHGRAILVGYTSRFINKHPYDGMTFRACNFRMDKFKTVIDCGLLGNFSYAFCNRPLNHTYDASCQLALPFAQKKKWAKTHRTTHPTIRASCKLYENGWTEASGRTARRLRSGS